MSAIVKADDAVLDEERVQLLKNTIAKGASQGEFEIFVQVCRRLRLDPFARQIFLVKRGGTAQPQVSIDGFRLVAERTGQYRGQTTPQWCGKDGVWTDVWLSDEPPAAARCGVYRDGFSEPLVRVAKFKSYVQHSNHLWKSMPEVLLSKCAESLALRAAFPNELSGVYGVEEMGQASNDRETPRSTRKTLDDVAVAEIEPDSEPQHDEYGLPIPQHPCPVVAAGKPNAGKPWSELPGPLVHKMYTEHSAKMTREQIEWAEYLISHRACRKEKENATT